MIGKKKGSPNFSFLSSLQVRQAPNGFSNHASATVEDDGVQGDDSEAAAGLTAVAPPSQVARVLAGAVQGGHLASQGTQVVSDIRGRLQLASWNKPFIHSACLNLVCCVILEGKFLSSV